MKTNLENKKKILYKTVILFVIITLLLSTYINYKLYSYEIAEILIEIQLEVKRIHMFSIIKDIIAQQSFKNSFMEKKLYDTSLSDYYQLVLCHPLFPECFLDIYFKDILEVLKKHGAEQATETLKNLLVNYINNTIKTTNDVLLKCLPLNFKVETKIDLTIILTEYAKLLTISKEKLNLVTSQAFFTEFFYYVETTLNITIECCSKEQLEIIKKSYNFMINQIKTDDFRYQINSLLINILMIATFTKMILWWTVYYSGIQDLAVFFDFSISELIEDGGAITIIFGEIDLHNLMTFYIDIIRNELELRSFDQPIPTFLLNGKLYYKLAKILIQRKGLQRSIQFYRYCQRMHQWIWSPD